MENNMILTLLVYMVYIVFAVASITYTICITSIFKPVREYISNIHPKLEELIHCPYCLGHYVTILILIVIGIAIPFTGIKLLDYILSTFAIMGAVSILHNIMLKAYEPVARQMMFRKQEQNK